MPSVGEIRTALATAVESVNGLRSSPTVPDNPRPPIAVVMPERVEYDLNGSRGADTYFFSIIVLVGRADDRVSQNKIDTFIVGAQSVKKAVEADRTLGGAAQTCRVTGANNYGSIPVGEVLYLSVQFSVEVIA